MWPSKKLKSLNGNFPITCRIGNCSNCCRSALTRQLWGVDCCYVFTYRKGLEKSMSYILHWPLLNSYYFYCNYWTLKSTRNSSIVIFSSFSFRELHESGLWANKPLQIIVEQLIKLVPKLEKHFKKVSFFRIIKWKILGLFSTQRQWWNKFWQRFILI